MGTQGENTEDTIEFWIDPLNIYNLCEGSNNNVACQDMPLAQQYSLPPVLSPIFFPLLICLHSPAGAGQTHSPWPPCMPTSYQAASVRSNCYVSCVLGRSFQSGIAVERQDSLEEGLLSDPDENKIPQLNPFLLAYGLALADSPERLLLAWTNENEPKIKSL